VAERVLSHALAQGNAPQQPEGRPEPAAAAGIVGASPAMQNVFRQIALVARSHVCVNLFGESGTGKELVARAIHNYSDRARGPFVPAHIAALSPSVAESELFGHVRGAFTGADQDRPGLFQQANGGTLFLDEVAEIPLATQVKLLRALEYGEVWPVGASRPVTVDLRVVSATHQDLLQCAARGAFRHDLLYRLISFQIRLPPLRERLEDIDELSQHFLGLLRPSATQKPMLSEEALVELRRRPWHGNVRELRNTLETALVLSGKAAIQVHHLPSPMPASAAHGVADDGELPRRIAQWVQIQLQAGAEPNDLYARLQAVMERPLLEAILRHCRGQCAAAARLLGIHRVTLRKKLDELGITSAAD
jgi:two-component system nitrogen regulation response regulator GlnG